MVILACLAAAKRGGEGENPQSPSLYPSTLSPTPFDVCYAGFVHTGVSPGNRLPNKRRKSAGDKVAHYSSISSACRGSGDSNMREVLEGLRTFYVFLCPCTASFLRRCISVTAVWGISAEVLHWCRVATQVWVVLLIGWNKFFTR